MPGRYTSGRDAIPYVFASDRTWIGMLQMTATGPGCSLPCEAVIEANSLSYGG
jgi:hypothetical protein